MRYWWQWVLIAWVCGAAMAAPERTLPDQFTDALGEAQYDCVLVLKPAERLSRSSAVRVTLEAGAGRASLQLAITRDRITITPVAMDRAAKRATVKAGVTPGEPCTLTVLRRDTWLGLLLDGALIYREPMPRAGGALGAITAGAGWTVEDARAQTPEIVTFADNFMRAADDQDQWSKVSGTWVLQSAWDRDPKGNDNRFKQTIFAQNPFAWVGQGNGKPAFCTAGKPTWDDYTLTAAVCPPVDGAVGVAVNVDEAGRALLVRWSPVGDRGAGGNRLSLYLLEGGKRTLLEESPGGYLPAQWYRLTVVSNLAGVAVLVDGRVRLVAQKVAPWRGGIGLYAEGAIGAVFDDVTAYGGSLNTDLLNERQQLDINQRFIDDRNGMQKWSVLRNNWTPMPGSPRHMIQNDRFYGEYWISLTLRPNHVLPDPKATATVPPPNKGELWLVIESNGQDTLSGYRAVLSITPENQFVYTLFRDKDVLATATREPLQPGEDYSLRLRHRGQRVWLEVDGEVAVDARDPRPLSGPHPGYYADGCFARVTDILATGRNVLDYTFSDAPVDWIDQGTWMPTTRWSCAPHWSFLGGWSHGDAVLWHKQRFTGDHSFEAFFGLKMEYPREREIYDNRYRNFAISICADGRDPRSGYVGIYGAPDEKGTPNQRTVLLRNGVVVASAAVKMPGRGAAHREWFGLSLRKIGDTVEFWLDGKRLLEYRDDDPLSGGIPAIWTTDNGIALARAFIHYAEPPRTADLPRVAIDEPWYPEWANVGETLALAFPNACATSGHAVSLKAAPREVPKGEEDAVSVAGTRARFQPKAAGAHWYQVTATDGKSVSPPFHLLLPVFDPSLGRDDSHAVALYRFDEGTGDVIHDRSPGAPLHIPISKDAPVAWQPGQGLSLHGIVKLASNGPASKLLSIAESRACTLEAWVSTDTLYPTTSWVGNLCSWEAVANQPNLSLMHRSQALNFTTRGDKNAVRQLTCGGFRTGLQHYAATWDGAKVTFYINGAQVQAVNLPMDTTTWVKEAPLYLGALSNNQFNYFGTYYLLAVHNACLTADQVKRHYQAGPSAK